MLRPAAAPVSSPYGWRTIAGRRNFHSGQDYGAGAGAPVYASAAGTVIDVYPPGRLARYGLAIVIKHSGAPRPLYSLYAHLASAAVTKGQAINGGQQIGTVGDTAGTREDPNARTQRAHLHFELLDRWPPRGIDLDRIDPTPYLDRAQADARPEAGSRTATAGGFGALLLIGVAWWYLSTRKRKRRPGLTPAGAGTTDTTGAQWRP